MRIPKFVVLSGAAVLGTVGSLQAQRDDSDLQSKAREELHRKMMEMNSTPATAPASVPAAPVKMPPPAPVMTTPPPPVKAPPPMMADPAPTVVPTAAAVPPASGQVFIQPPNPDRAKAEEMMRQKMAELNAQEASSTPPANASPNARAAAKADQEARDVAKTEEKLKAKADAKARAAAKSGFPPTAVPVMAVQPPAISPAMGSKEQRLEVLLQQYKADQITPQEYHAQRAKILAEP